MKNENIEKHFAEKGYKKYNPTPFDNEGIEARFQKRFDDEKGKRYFIDIVKWSGFTHPHTGKKFPPSYEYETQMYQKGTHNAVDFEFHSSWSLEEVEAFMEKQFETGMFDYYEEWCEA